MGVKRHQSVAPVKYNDYSTFVSVRDSNTG